MCTQYILFGHQLHNHMNCQLRGFIKSQYTCIGFGALPFSPYLYFSTYIPAPSIPLPPLLSLYPSPTNLLLSSPSPLSPLPSFTPPLFSPALFPSSYSFLLLSSSPFLFPSLPLLPSQDTVFENPVQRLSDQGGAGGDGTEIL